MIKMMVCTQKQGLEKQPWDTVLLIGEDVSSVRFPSLLRNWLVWADSSWGRSGG